MIQDVIPKRKASENINKMMAGNVREQFQSAPKRKASENKNFGNR